MRVAETIRHKLITTLAPTRIEIIDESHRHAGHAGARLEGETHFRIEIVAAAFEGKARLERQRMVHAALTEELATRIHALSLKLMAPSEDSAATS